MVEVYIIAEGQTEEQFVKQIMAPAFRAMQIFIKPILLPTSKQAKGGAVSLERLQLNARNILRSKPDCILTTLLDLYALDTDFPRHDEARNITDIHQRCGMLETALQHAIVSSVGCQKERFIPHIQPYEFEGLLFSDVTALVGTEPLWASSKEELQRVRSSFETPEHINNSYETKPSKRLEQILRPAYKKTRHGPIAAKRVTLATMEQECRHFREWLDTLRALAG